MKKLLLSSLLLLSSALWAVPDQFVIKITNAGTTDCELKKQIVLFGHVSDHTTIPEAILPNQTKAFMMRSNRGVDKSILLTYACGDDQSVTFLVDNRDNHQVAGQVTVQNNIQATFKTYTPGIFSKGHNRPEIYWTLTH